MQVEVTPDEFVAIQKLNLECANAFPDPRFTAEYERFVYTGSYFDERGFEQGLRQILGDKVVNQGIKGEIIQIILKNEPTG